MEIFTERLKLKDILPERAKDIAKKYKLKEEDIEFIRKKNPLSAEDLTIEDDERAAIRYINTADVDRDSEIVLPSGGQVNDFKKSPTVLYAHNYQGLPIGKDIWLKLVQGKGWLAKTVYAKHQLAVDVYNLVKEKFLNTSSIGFIPLESIKPEDKDWDSVGESIKSEYNINEKVFNKAKRIYTKWLLLEHSDVPVASNISALNIAVGKGLKIESKELIDDLNIEITDEEDKSVNEIIDEIEDEVELSEKGKKKLKEGLKDVAEGKVEEIDIDNLEAELEEKNTVTKPEETEDYIHLPAKGEEGKHDGHRIRTITISDEEGIKALYCGECKKAITFLFDKSKGWTMAKAKKWMEEHGKNISSYYEGMEEATLDNLEQEEFTIKDIEDEIKYIAKVGNTKPAMPFQEEKQKEEPSKGFSLNEVYEIIKENRKLIDTLEKVIVELKAGAVLNRINKQDLKDAQAKIQKVLDSAETAEPTEEGKAIDELEIEDDRVFDLEELDDLEIEEKEAKKESDVFDIDEKELIEIIHSALESHINKSVENVSKNIKQDIDDNFKRLTGKVM